eukprot:4100259-Pyramimonas_sp.AAC.1
MAIAAGHNDAAGSEHGAAHSPRACLPKLERELATAQTSATAAPQPPTDAATVEAVLQRAQ